MPELRAAEACARVQGMDIHPAAVIIARVTYLLALQPTLTHRKGGLSIPVYLGDSMQLSISEIVGGKVLIIRVPPPPAGNGASGTPDANGREQLDFPDTFCRDPALFDKAIERMRSGSEAGMTRTQIEAALISGRLKLSFQSRTKGKCSTPKPPLIAVSMSCAAG